MPCGICANRLDERMQVSWTAGTPATAASHTPMSGTTGGEADTTADADMGMLVMEDADDAAKDPIAQRASQLALAELGGIDIVHNDFDAFLVQLQDICPIMS